MRFSVHLCQRKFLNKHLRFPIHDLHVFVHPPLLSKSYTSCFFHVRTSPVSLRLPSPVPTPVPCHRERSPTGEDVTQKNVPSIITPRLTWEVVLLGLLLVVLRHYGNLVISTERQRHTTPQEPHEKEPFRLDTFHSFFKQHNLKLVPGRTNKSY